MAIEDASDSNSQFFQFIKKQKSDIEAARARKGEKPTDRQPRQELIDDYLFQHDSINAEKADGRQQRPMFTIIGEPYLPSVASVQELKKMMICDLQLETHHRGFYLVLRCVVPPIRQNAILNVVEDEAGDASMFSLYQQESENVRPAVDVLREKIIILLKEPYFKLTSGGSYGIRVDHPTDVVWLSDDDANVPRAWRATPASQKDEKTADQWKQDGNSSVSAGKYSEAISIYSKGLSSLPDSHMISEAEVLHNNLALCYLKLEKYDKALSAATFIPSLEKRSEKALYRGSLALYGLRRFTECLEYLNFLVTKFSGSALGKLELARVQLRYNEQERGDYNFKRMYKEAKQRPPKIDAATFVGSVEVRDTPGKGRGLFTSKAVKCGDLLACEKAFSYISAEAAGPGEGSYQPAGVLINLITNRVKMGTEAAHIPNVYQKLTNNPSIAHSFLDLCHDSYEPVSEKIVDGLPIVDSFLIERIVSLNTFGCPITSRHQELSKGQTGGLSEASGVWPLAAYINHSCIANCARTFIGDMLIMRAARDLPPNTELTWCYHNPADRTNLQKSLFEHWGFNCSCLVCQEEEITGAVLKKQKIDLLARVSKTSTADKLLFNQLDQVYTSHAQTVPRFEVFFVCYSRVMHFLLSDYKLSMVLTFAEKALESLGFVIDSFNGSCDLVVRNWGSFVPEVSRLWQILMMTWRAKGKSRLAESAKKYLKMTYLVSVAGEDGTFTEDYDPVIRQAFQKTPH